MCSSYNIWPVHFSFLISIDTLRTVLQVAHPHSFSIIHRFHVPARPRCFHFSGSSLLSTFHSVPVLVILSRAFPLVILRVNPALHSSRGPLVVLAPSCISFPGILCFLGCIVGIHSHSRCLEPEIKVKSDHSPYGPSSEQALDNPVRCHDHVTACPSQPITAPQAFSEKGNKYPLEGLAYTLIIRALLGTELEKGDLPTLAQLSLSAVFKHRRPGTYRGRCFCQSHPR